MYDLVISGARVIDPESGLDGVMNVGVQDGAIAAVSANQLSGTAEIDGAGLVLSPGFIDLHSHEDNILDAHEGLCFPRQTAQCSMKTGFTYILTGNCGFGNFPLGGYLAALKNENLPISCASLAGNLALRHQLGLGNYDKASPAQLVTLKKMAADAMAEGAAGVSFGLEYAPGADFAEVLALCQAAADAGKFFSVHMRVGTSKGAVPSIEEVISAARLTGAALQISHLASMAFGKGRDGRSNIAFAKEQIEAARADGFDVACDSYPFDAWATSIQSGVFDHGFDDFCFKIEDIEILTGRYAGQYCTPELFEKLRKAPPEEDAAAACHNATPMEDIEAVYRMPYCSVASDAILSVGGGHVKGHPRSAGTPARFLKEFVREKKMFTLAEGLRRLTLLPAQRLGLDKKGRLKEGCDADLVLFDPGTIADKAAYGMDVCVTPPAGIRAVISGGKVVFEGAV